MSDFDKKVVMITGASAGIGAALAREFAKKGARLVLTARRLDRLKALAGELEKAGTQALPLSCDVTREGDLEKAVQQIRERFGNIDVVVANAGFGILGRLENLKMEDYRRQWETNVFGVLRTVYATLEELKKSKGTLVLMSSVFGHSSAPEASPYTMSKFAVRALADSLYAELAPLGIAVVLISPGFVVSELRHVDRKGVYHPRSKDPVPSWLQMSTEKAARQILKAVAHKDREKVITLHGKLLVFIADHFPGLLTRFFKWAADKYRWDKGARER